MAKKKAAKKSAAKRGGEAAKGSEKKRGPGRPPKPKVKKKAPSREVMAALNKALEAAKQKVSVDKDGKLAAYLPGSQPKFRLHHLKLGKMKREDPKTLTELVQKHIIDVKKPKLLILNRKKANRRVGSKGRKPAAVVVAAAPRVDWTDAEFQLLLDNARATKNHKRVRQLRRLQLPVLKQRLCTAIMKGKADKALWKNYCEAVSGKS
jgi:hypothetical protein